jgi:hypothetical protein
MRPAGETAKHSKWFYVRLAMLVATVCAAPAFDKVMHSEFPLSDPPTLWFVLLIICFGAFAVVFVTSLQLINPLMNEVWRIPSWEEAPFGLKQPLLAFHAGAWVCVVQGAVMAVYALVHSFNYAWVLFLAFGLGGLLGVRFVVWFSRDRFSQ